MKLINNILLNKMNFYLILIIVILINSIFLQNKIKFLKELYSNFDISTQQKIKINNDAQDAILNNAAIRYNNFNKKVDVLNKNRKNLDKIIEKKKNSNKQILRKIIKLENKLADLKKY